MTALISDRSIGIRLLLYYHSGYPCYHAVDEPWWKAIGGYKADKTYLYNNWIAIITEIGERYGGKIAGWFFDGAHRYYDPHFDGSDLVGPNHAPWRRMTTAAKAGNSDRIICYNSWIMPKLTDFQDYFCGEGYRMSKELPAGGSGIFPEGDHPQAGLQAHTNYRLESHWGHLEPNKDISPPRFTAEELVEMVEDGISRKNVHSINMEIYEDGSVSPESLEVMRVLRKAVQGN